VNVPTTAPPTGALTWCELMSMQAVYSGQPVIEPAGANFTTPMLEAVIRLSKICGAALAELRALLGPARVKLVRVG